MADEKEPQLNEEPEEDASPEAANAAGDANRGPIMLLVGVIMGALALGVTVGGFFVGPAVIDARSASSVGGDEKKQASKAHGKEAKKKKSGGHGSNEKMSLYQIDHIIVNPAGSHGDRFVLCTVAIEVDDPKVEQTLRDRDAMVRDVVIEVIESQTMAELTRPGARSELKRNLAQAVQPIAGDDVSLKVYLPQFVIQ